MRVKLGDGSSGSVSVLFKIFIYLAMAGLGFRNTGSF